MNTGLDVDGGKTTLGLVTSPDGATGVGATGIGATGFGATGAGATGAASTGAGATATGAASTGAVLAATGFAEAADSAATVTDGLDGEGVLAIIGNTATGIAASGAITPADWPGEGLLSFFCCGTPGLIWISRT
jgi:hypothetical protein